MLTYAERPVKTVMNVMIASRPAADLERLATRQAVNVSYRRLACAIIDQAAHEARYSPRCKDRQYRAMMVWRALDARAWLASPDCLELLEALGIEPAEVAAWVDGLPALARPDTPRPAEDDYQEGE